MVISGIIYSHNFLILQKIAQATKNPDIPTTDVLNNLISFKNSTKCLPWTPFWKEVQREWEISIRDFCWQIHTRSPLLKRLPVVFCISRGFFLLKFKGNCDQIDDTVHHFDESKIKKTSLLRPFCGWPTVFTANFLWNFQWP